jgi:hypothetical protein
MQESFTPVVENLLQRLTTDHSDLVGKYQQSLRANIFTNRFEVRPNMLGLIATQEADTLLKYLSHPNQEIALQRGRDLCEIGLGEQSVLGLGEASRQFFLAQINNNAIVPALQAIDAYHHTVIKGFIEGREKVILKDAEPLLTADGNGCQSGWCDNLHSRSGYAGYDRC